MKLKGNVTFLCFRATGARLMLQKLMGKAVMARIRHTNENEGLFTDQHYSLMISLWVARLFWQKVLSTLLNNITLKQSIS